jgi:hypothetical protein
MFFLGGNEHDKKDVFDGSPCWVDNWQQQFGRGQVF